MRAAHEDPSLLGGWTGGDPQEEADDSRREAIADAWIEHQRQAENSPDRADAAE